MFCNGNLVPGGKDQLPHVELTRQIARRFNDKYCEGSGFFTLPDVLLSDSPLLMGLDGRKMGKSLNNSIYLKSSEDETQNLLKKAVTDNNKDIFYDPLNRPEVSNLLKLGSLCSGKSVDEVGQMVDGGGGGKLKAILTEIINEYFRESRKERMKLMSDPGFLLSTLINGNQRAEEVGQDTLKKVHQYMGLDIDSLSASGY